MTLPLSFFFNDNTNGRLGLPHDSNAEYTDGTIQIVIPTKVPIPNTFSKTFVLQS